MYSLSETRQFSIMKVLQLQWFISLAAVAAARYVGHGVIVNNCEFNVSIDVTPAAGNGYDQLYTELSQHQVYSQTFIELAFGGWSLKISLGDPADIMQFEYTLDPYEYGGIVWFDLSYVNGNPFDGNWSIVGDSPTGDCHPEYRAYEYSTDDVNGMQNCPMDSTVMVELCLR